MPPDSPPKARDSGTIAAQHGVPVHYARNAHVELLRLCPALGEHTVAVSKLFLHVVQDSYDDGFARGRDRAVEALKGLTREIGPVWHAALCRASALSPVRPPTLRAVLTEWRSARPTFAAGEADIRDACRAAGLPLAD